MKPVKKIAEPMTRNCTPEDSPADNGTSDAGGSKNAGNTRGQKRGGVGANAVAPKAKAKGK